jgi:hypothetical protein
MPNGTASRRCCPLPRRWVVEHTCGGLGRCRRLRTDDERLPSVSKTCILLAMIPLLPHRMPAVTLRKHALPPEAANLSRIARALA